MTNTRTVGMSAAPSHAPSSLYLALLLLAACSGPPSGRTPEPPCGVAPPSERLQQPQLDDSSSAVSTDNLASWTRLLASEELSGRGAATEEAHAAADLFARYFERLGWRPMPDGRGYCQPYMLADLPDQNVVALLPSAGAASRWLLLGAHYDGQGTSPGGRIVFPSADDNASGVAALLEMARLLTTSPQRPWSMDVGIVIGLFGGEEHAQSGSKAWVAEPPVPLDAIELMINLDMVGRRLGGAEQPSFLFSQSSPSLGPALARAAKRAGLDWRELAPEEVDELAFDHTPFAPHVLTLFLTSGDHPDRHTPRDNQEALDHEQIKKTLAFVAALLAELFPANSEAGDTAYAAWFESRVADRRGSPD